MFFLNLAVVRASLGLLAVFEMIQKVDFDSGAISIE